MPTETPTCPRCGGLLVRVLTPTGTPLTCVECPESMPSEAEADAILRDAGEDPDAVAQRGAALVAGLHDPLARARALLDAATPGPWTIRRSPRPVVQSSEGEVADVGGWGGSVHQEDADARAIALLGSVGRELLAVAEADPRLRMDRAALPEQVMVDSIAWERMCLALDRLTLALRAHLDGDTIRDVGVTQCEMCRRVEPCDHLPAIGGPVCGACQAHFKPNGDPDLYPGGEGDIVDLDAESERIMRSIADAKCAYINATTEEARAAAAVEIEALERQLLNLGGESRDERCCGACKGTGRVALPEELQATLDAIRTLDRGQAPTTSDLRRVLGYEGASDTAINQRLSALESSGMVRRGPRRGRSYTWRAVARS